MTSTSNIAIHIKRSGESGNTPSDLEHGEIAINYADGKLYYKNDANTVKYITNQDTFGTVNSNGQLILATNPTDILNIVAGNLISISTDTISKTITINSDNSLANAIANGTQTLANVTITANGSLTFGDGSTMNFRGTKMVTNSDWAGGLQINSLVPGDIYYDDTQNKLFVWTNFGTYNDFYDITPPA